MMSSKTKNVKSFRFPPQIRVTVSELQIGLHVLWPAAGAAKGTVSGLSPQTVQVKIYHPPFANELRRPYDF